MTVYVLHIHLFLELMIKLKCNRTSYILKQNRYSDQVGSCEWAMPPFTAGLSTSFHALLFPRMKTGWAVLRDNFARLNTDPGQNNGLVGSRGCIRISSMFDDLIERASSSPANEIDTFVGEIKNEIKNISIYNYGFNAYKPFFCWHAGRES